MEKDYVTPKIKITFVERTDVITASTTAVGVFKTDWLGFEENGGDE